MYNNMDACSKRFSFCTKEVLCSVLVAKDLHDPTRHDLMMRGF